VYGFLSCWLRFGSEKLENFHVRVSECV
jgi:hypothetical protein